MWLIYQKRLILKQVVIPISENYFVPQMECKNI